MFVFPKNQFDYSKATLDELISRIEMSIDEITMCLYNPRLREQCLLETYRGNLDEMSDDFVRAGTELDPFHRYFSTHPKLTCTECPLGSGFYGCCAEWGAMDSNPSAATINAFLTKMYDTKRRLIVQRWHR